jgi:hypothetical protein
MDEQMVLKVALDGGDVEFMLESAFADVEQIDDVQAVVLMPGGTRWGARFMTAEALTRQLAALRPAHGGAPFLTLLDVIAVPGRGLEAMCGSIQALLDQARVQQ